MARFALVLHALTLIIAMILLVPALTQTFGGPRGYLLALLAYWLGFCLPVIALHVRGRHGPKLFSEKLDWRDWWVPGLLLLQVTLVALVLFVPHTAMLTTHGAMLAGLIALFHAPLEEAAWRGGFYTRFADRPRLGLFLGWILFTLWHVPLGLSQNLVMPGGMAGLVGMAAALGLFWSWLVWRTGSIFWVAIAHCLSTTLGLWLLFDANEMFYQP
jgi:membrane protease YdiL (CAAX protease family)